MPRSQYLTQMEKSDRGDSTPQYVTSLIPLAYCGTLPAVGAEWYDSMVRVVTLYLLELQHEQRTWLGTLSGKPWVDSSLF